MAVAHARLPLLQRARELRVQRPYVHLHVQRMLVQLMGWKPGAWYILVPNDQGKKFPDLEAARRMRSATITVRGPDDPLAKAKIYFTSDGGRSYVEVNEETEGLILPELDGEQLRVMYEAMREHFWRASGERCACGELVPSRALHDEHRIQVAYRLGLLHATERAAGTRIYLPAKELR